MGTELEALQIQKRGTAITTSGVSQNFAMPTTQANTIPKYVRISATVPAYVAIVQSGAGTAAAGDIMVIPGDAVVLATGNAGFIAAIQVAAAGVLQVSPIENQ